MSAYDQLSESHKREFNRLKQLQIKQLQLRAEGSRRKVLTRHDQVKIDNYYKMMGYLSQVNS